jgi:uncharacterized membrane protein YhaH (DUF805 family)
MNTYLAVLKKYGDLKGRTRRSEFWPFVLINAVVGFVLIGVDIDILRTAYFRVTLANVFGLAIILPTSAVIVRRLHDTGRSGWWGLPAFVQLFSFSVPRSLLVRLIMLLMPSLDVASSSATILLFVVFIGYPAAGLLLYYLASDSKPGPNKYGPNPKEPATLATP